MAQRFVLNETSYHGSGAVANVAAEAKARGFRKALVLSLIHISEPTRPY